MSSHVKSVAVLAALAAWSAPLAAQQRRGFTLRSLVEAGPSVSINVPKFKDEEARWQLAAAVGFLAEGRRDAFGGAFHLTVDKSLIQGALQARYHRAVSSSMTLITAAGPIVYADADQDLALAAPGWTIGLAARHRSRVGLGVRLDVLPMRDGPGMPTPGARRTYRTVAAGIQADGTPGVWALAAGLLVVLIAGGGTNHCC